MKSHKKNTGQLLAVAVVAAMIAVPAAQAEVSASVGVASTYLWRGYDLGSGTPAVSGDINYSNAGFYTGIWGSSGDTSAGTEYDLYAGYGMGFGENDMFSVDLSVWNYNYPTGAGYTDGETDPFEFTEVVLTLGAGPVALSYYDNVAGGSGYSYYTLSGSFDAFTVLLGMHDSVSNAYDELGHVISHVCPSDDEDGECKPVHLNVSYAYNDNLSFTLSQFVADEADDDDMKFVVSYSLPIGE